MNPLTIWTSLTPWTKRIIFIGIFAVIIVSMFTGFFPDLVALIRPGASK